MGFMDVAESAVPFLKPGIDMTKGFIHDDMAEVDDAMSDGALDFVAKTTGLGTVKKVADLGLKTAGLKSSGHYLKYGMFPGMALTEHLEDNRKEETIATGQALAAHPEMLPRTLQSMVGVADDKLTNGVQSGADFMAALHGHMPSAAAAPPVAQTPGTMENIARTAEMVSPARDHRATFASMFGG